MGGVDLWQNEDDSYDDLDPQSMHDKILEVVSISGTWHLGKLQVCCVFQSVGGGGGGLAKLFYLFLPVMYIFQKSSVAESFSAFYI